MPTLYAAITNHGFGHATRVAGVLALIQAQCPTIKLIIATTAPRWLLGEYLHGDFVYHPRIFDVGVVQSDGLTMDKPATLAKWQILQQQAEQIIETEAQFLREQQVDLVLADIPHLAVAIAHAVSVPCWMMSNFGWDFIYRAWGGEFMPLADWISSSYRQCDRLFRLPFCEPMSSFPVIEDVGLTGYDPLFSPETVRQLLDIQDQSKTVLLTFGGFSLQGIQYPKLSQFPDYQFITFDQDAPSLPNLKVVDRATRIRPIDVMQVCDLVVTKPGYGTLSEVYRSGKPVVCVTRTDFAESDLLIAGVRNYMPHLIIDPHEFYRGDWQFLTAQFQPPQRNTKLDTNGSGTIAEAVISYLQNL